MTYDEQHEALRQFAIAMLRCWPDGDVDGGYLQDKAAELGLLVRYITIEPCGDNCNCRTYFSDAEFAEVIECYRKAKWLIAEASDG